MQLSPQLRFDPDKLLLSDSDSDTTIELTFAEARILEALSAEAGQVVSKATLLEAGWPARVVGDSSLQNALSTLRKKLSPYRDIELKTIPRRGYTLHLPEPQSLSPRRFTKPAMAAVVLAVLVLLVGVLFWLDPSPRARFAEQTLPSRVSGVEGPMWVLTEPTAAPVDKVVLANRVANQLVPEPGWQPPFDRYQGMALLSEQGDSLVLCPGYDNGQCPGKSLISIFGAPNDGGHQRLSDFLATKIRMEEKTYNSLKFEELGDDTGGMVEQLYFGDAYFKLDQDQRLARADLRISAVPQEAHSGLFYFAACVTDEDCHTTPVKYRVRGRYIETKERWGDRRVTRYTVTPTSVELSSPNRLSKMARQLYREFRRSELGREELVFYRLYLDDKTAIWMLPFADNSMVWMQRRTLHL
ncbi:helix-turn-helix domain-containing protein [Marinobacter hydrocarbonoclasticus]|nr:helix-turn-helix domain-containing protein [Marinobacter nauticus]